MQYINPSCQGTAAAAMKGPAQAAVLTAQNAPTSVQLPSGFAESVQMVPLPSSQSTGCKDTFGGVWLSMLRTGPLRQISAIRHEREQAELSHIAGRRSEISLTLLAVCCMTGPDILPCRVQGMGHSQMAQLAAELRAAQYCADHGAAAAGPGAQCARRAQRAARRRARAPRSGIATRPGRACAAA